MTIYYLTADLMFSSRVVSLAERQAAELRLFMSMAALEEAIALDLPERVIVDLELPGLDIGALVVLVRKTTEAAKIIAYGPHVNVDKLAAAQEAGCDAVLSNGEFNRRMDEFLTL